MLIKLVPFIYIRNEEEFFVAFKGGAKGKKVSFLFKGVEFFYSDTQMCFMQLTSLNQPLPSFFTDGTLKLKHIEISSQIKQRSLPVAGVYNGKRLGFKDAVCIVSHKPTPNIFVCGAEFRSVVDLCKKVLQGGLQPTTPAQTR